MEGITFHKEASVIEQKAYRDTWGKGLDGYLHWFFETVLLLRELLTDNGGIYVHLDWHVAHYAKCILDEVFGPDQFQNEIVWQRTDRLRLMFRGEGTGYVERVDVIGTARFMELVEQLEKDEDLKLEQFELGRDPLVIKTIVPDPAKADKDIEIPTLTPILVRKKTLAEEIAALDVSAFQCQPFPMKQGTAEAKNFRYEGYDVITLEKLVEREYRMPEPQTAQEVISYYAKRIAQDVKLPSQFAALAPKVAALV